VETVDSGDKVEALLAFWQKTNGCQKSALESQFLQPAFSVAPRDLRKLVFLPKCSPLRLKEDEEKKMKT